MRNADSFGFSGMATPGCYRRIAARLSRFEKLIGIVLLLAGMFLLGPALIPGIGAVKFAIWQLVLLNAFYSAFLIGLGVFAMIRSYRQRSNEPSNGSLQWGLAVFFDLWFVGSLMAFLLGMAQVG